MTRAGGGRFRRGPARRRRRRRGRDEWREQSFLELMSQLFRDLDFSIGSEAGYRIPLGAMIVQFNLEHSGCSVHKERPRGCVARLLACRVPAMKCSSKTNYETDTAEQNACREVRHVNIRDSLAAGQGPLRSDCFRPQSVIASLSLKRPYTRKG